MKYSASREGFSKVSSADRFSFNCYRFAAAAAQRLSKDLFYDM